MEDNELIKNFLPFIFYRFLSEKLEMHMNKELVDDNLTFEQAWKDDEYKECLIDEGLCELGYFLEPRYLFRNILKKAGSDDFLEDLIKSLECINNYTIENDSQEAFDNIFEDIDFNSPKFGKSY
ncbi:MAG: type I restriction-modification system subunit M N-terminal domain-containing protein, partial [Methanobrevibacter sp.]|nr:type I restriction-modification system subunit M N-terminal domain-containing protein [Methanobrevibacter sp.]